MDTYSLVFLVMIAQSVLSINLLVDANIQDVHLRLKRPNILFVVSDDMRPQLTSYGIDRPSKVSPKMHTPHLDRLAEHSFLAGHAHVQYAMCGPSRTSLLTSRRPDTTHVYDNLHYFRKVGGNFTTLPQYFKQNGYVAVGLGKIFHPGAKAGNDDPPSWSEPYWHPSNENYWWLNRTQSWMAVPVERRQQWPLPDEQIGQHAVKTLQRLAPKASTGEQPFIMAVGFLKPHLPFVFPEEFLQFYPLDMIHMPDNGYAPVSMPHVAWNPYYELRTYHDIAALHVSGAVNTSLPANFIRDLRRAYYSSLSFTDHLVGVLLNELKKLNLDKNTIVSFIGDHGWQLGEHGEWCKQTNFELSTHAPLMISVPGLTDTPHHSEHLIEFVDIFPTLVELAGLPTLDTCPRTRSNSVNLCTEGTSFVPLITGIVKRKPLKVWKLKALSQFRRFVHGSEVMGYTMRTDRFRYTEWVYFKGKPVFKPVWNKLYGVELYDHSIDPEENRNMAYNTTYSSVQKTLKAQLESGWRVTSI